MSVDKLPSLYMSSWHFALVIIYQHYLNYGKYTASNDIWWWIVSTAGLGRRHSWHIWQYYPHICHKICEKEACHDRQALTKTEPDTSQTPITGTEAVLTNLTAVRYQNCIHTQNSWLSITLDYFTYYYSVVCLTTGPKPLPKRFLHTVWSKASPFKWEYPLLSLRSSSSFLRLLPLLLVTSISPFIFPSITCFRWQFLLRCDQSS